MTVHVLVVDDSSVARSLIKVALAADPEIEVVGECSSGEEALAIIPALQPDLVTLDIEMPGIGGLETVRRIRELDKFLPVVMFSSLTLAGADATLEALTLGADDYATKPSGMSNRAEAIATMADDLLPKIKALAARRAWRTLRRANVATAARLEQRAIDSARRPHGSSGQRPQGRRAGRTPVAVVAIGASTGGPEALGRILPALPADLPVPVVVVQHMPELFTALMAGRLDRRSVVTVREAQDREQLQPGVVYIAPGGRHLSVQQRGAEVVAHLDDGPKLHSSRPAVDRLFSSLPAAYGDRVLGLILTGMGRDGLLGCRAVHSAGGRVAVQDEESSAVWGMPGAVAEAGLATESLDVARIADFVTKAVWT